VDLREGSRATGPESFRSHNDIMYDKITHMGGQHLPSSCYTTYIQACTVYIYIYILDTSNLYFNRNFGMSVVSGLQPVTVLMQIRAVVLPTRVLDAEGFDPIGVLFSRGVFLLLMIPP